MASITHYFDQPAYSLNDVQRSYLAPLSLIQRGIRRSLYFVSWLAVRSSLHLKVEGLKHIPAQRPFILAPNHTSSLDPFLLASAIPYRTLKHCNWAAAARAIMKNRFRKVSNRLAGSVPIWKSRSALAVGAEVISQKRNLIWFPEGHRTRTGELQKFRPGIGYLAVHTGVPVVPIRILGGYEAMPPGKKLPHWRTPVTVRLGEPMLARSSAQGDKTEAAKSFTSQLHEAMLAL